MKVFYLKKKNNCLVDVYSIDLALLRGIMKKFEKLVCTKFTNLKVDPSVPSATYETTDVLKFLVSGQKNDLNSVKGIVESADILGKQIDTLSTNIPESYFMIEETGLERTILTAELNYDSISGSYSSTQALKEIAKTCINDPSMDLKEFFKAIVDSPTMKQNLDKETINSINAELLEIYRKEDNMYR